MNKLAIDIVLLPPKEINDLSVKINKNLNPKEGETVFENGTCLPHISLLMGVLNVSERKKAEKLLKDAAKKFQPLELEISRVEKYILSDGKAVMGFGVSTTLKLRELHETLLESSAFLGNDADAEMFYEQPIRQEIIEYLRSFKTEHSFKNFRPHITLGVGKHEVDIRFPTSFTASTIALCRLGNYGTCRKILFQTTLGKK